MIDPLQIYHYDPNLPLCGGLSARQQVGGFIRSFPYDEVVIGSSMTQNMSLETLRQHFHHDPIRLSMAGATVATQALALRAALNTGKVKYVLWGLDQPYLEYSSENKFKNTPVELFEDSPKIVLTYLLSLRTLGFSMAALKNRLLPKSLNINLENFENWHQTARFSKEAVLLQYHAELQRTEKIPTKHQRTNFTQKIRNFNDDVAALIRSYPNIEFKIFLPPYSLAYHKIKHFQSKTEYAEYRNTRNILLEELTKIPNVKIYDFETDLEIISNLDNYMDPTHYSFEISNYIIQSMNEDRRLVTINTIDAHRRAYDRIPVQSFSHETAQSQAHPSDFFSTPIDQR